MWSEADECRPVNVYGQTKLAAELRVAAEWPHHVILRSSIIMGPLPPLQPVGRTLFLQFVVSYPHKLRCHTNELPLLLLASPSWALRARGF